MDTALPFPYPPARPDGPFPAGGRPAAPLHLLRRPSTAEGFALDTTAPEEQHFVLSAELPDDHELFTDGPGTFHDVLFPAETMHQAAHFIAQQYFRVPADRPEAFASSSVDVLDLSPWRRTGRAAHLAMELTLTPGDVVNGVPRGLECVARVAIDGVNCGLNRTRLVFVMPGVHRSHRARGRRESLNDSCAVSAPGADGALRPARVGRTDPRNVLVGPPLRVLDGEFLLPVDPAPEHGLFRAAADGPIPGSLFLEASRQASLLVAAELHGFEPGHAVLTHWRTSYRGLGDTDLPLACTVSSRRPTRDAAGRPVARMRVVFSQGSRVVASASASLLQDC
ncbi:AfsA-related hotdog domain-containing protein [Kitasatospora sp. NPDC127067]|uniref:AfsA-related hotdog domain-containing protein n=1 Tax=Kitasatospora sp. NPDC127067 TaxID=3347126 RepID=UPI0036614920